MCVFRICFFFRVFLFSFFCCAVARCCRSEALCVYRSSSCQQCLCVTLLKRFGAHRACALLSSSTGDVPAASLEGGGFSHFGDPLVAVLWCLTQRCAARSRHCLVKRVVSSCYAVFTPHPTSLAPVDSRGGRTSVGRTRRSRCPWTVRPPCPSSATTASCKRTPTCCTNGSLRRHRCVWQQRRRGLSPNGDAWSVPDWHCRLHTAVTTRNDGGVV